MSKTKAQKSAEERAAKKSAIQPAAVEQPKPAPAAASAQPATPSKQQQTIEKLTVALRQLRQIEVKPEMLRQDGKYILINIGPTWPVMRIGANGGVVLPDIKSYKEGLDTWVKADELLARQTAREAKKTQATAPAQPPAKAEQKQVTA